MRFYSIKELVDHLMRILPRRFVEGGMMDIRHEQVVGVREFS